MDQSFERGDFGYSICATNGASGSMIPILGEHLGIGIGDFLNGKQENSRE